MMCFSDKEIHFDINLMNKFIVNHASNVKIFICLITKQYIYRQRC